ncbi:MAG TPA: PQQ-dependent sugar dehydrogenase [Pseudomonadales bacterium]
MRNLKLTTLMLLSLQAAAAMAADQPPIGIAPVKLSESAYTFDTAEQHGIKVTVLAKGLPRSFGMAFLPNGDLLVSERGLQLRVIKGATGANPQLDPSPVSGIPQVDPPYRNGGLHDLALHPDFANNQYLYFTYNKGEPVTDPDQRRRSAVALMRGKYANGALTDVEELFVSDFGSTSGSRIAFAADGLLYMTTGAPFGEDAQDLEGVFGKVLRLKDDGSIPADNPFVGRSDVHPAIYSYGHRDQLGLTIHPDGTILAAEHGPNGGDEVNVIKPGLNYGWPNISFGRNYDGPRISDLPVADSIEQPQLVWVPSIGPSGLMVYTGDRFPAWKGNLFVGSARRGEVDRTGGLERVVLTDTLDDLRRETLLTELHQRIRDVRQGPDGNIYVLTDGDEFAVLRIEPN